MAKVLNLPVDICKFLTEIFMIMELRGNVGNWKSIKFEIRSRETPHNNPHIHASYGEYAISIDINTLLVKGNLPTKKQKFALEWVKNHREELLDKWDSIFINEKLPYTGSALPILERVE